MKSLIIFIFLVFSTSQAIAIADNDYVKLGSQALEKLNEQTALFYFEKAIKQNPKDINALNLASFVCTNIGYRTTDAKQKLNYYNNAISYANTALKINTKNDEANFVLAAAYGRKVFTITSPRARIDMSAKIKKYAELAIKSNPKHDKALTILGMWHYERSTLTYAEKKIVAFLGGLPDGNMADAVSYLEKSLKINPGNITTYYELGKVYDELGKKEQAKNLWTRGLNQKNEYENDAIIKLKIKKRLAAI